MKTPGFWVRRERWRRVTAIMARDGTDCAICGEPLDRRLRDHNHPRYVTFDHIIPRVAGGLDRIDNLRLAHQACNNARGHDPVQLADEAAL